MKIDATKTLRITHYLRRRFRNYVLPAVADKAIEKILENTSRGISFKGAAFKAYSQQQRKYRMLMGAGTTPNLFISGGLMGSLERKMIGGKMVVTFPKDYGAIAHGNQFRWKRPFVGYDSKQKEIYKQEAIKALNGFGSK